MRVAILFEGAFASMSPNRHYDIAPDGRFLMLIWVLDHPDMHDWQHGGTGPPVQI